MPHTKYDPQWLKEELMAEFANSLEEGIVVAVVTGDMSYNRAAHKGVVVRATASQVTVKVEGRTKEQRFWRKVRLYPGSQQIKDVNLSSVGDEMYTARLRPLDSYTKKWIKDEAEYAAEQRAEQEKKKSDWEALEPVLAERGKDVLRRRFNDLIDTMDYHQVVDSLSAIWDGVMRDESEQSQIDNDTIFEVVNRGQTRAKPRGFTRNMVK